MNRRVAFLLTLAGSAAAIGAACTFPEVSFVGGDAGASSGTNAEGGSSGTDLHPPSGDGGEQSVDPTKVGSDPDAGHVVNDDECLTKHPPCDCDEDGWADYACVDAGPVGGYDAGLKHWDCDDRITDRHPDAGYQQVAMQSGRPGLQDDWDCDNKVDTLYHQYSCTPGKIGIDLTCASTVIGFINDDKVPCGTQQPGWSCPTGGLAQTCKGQEGAAITQGCK
jgi:hypothetical protein